MKEKQKIIINTLVDAPISKVWEYWTNPNHIMVWNQPSSDWHTTRSENDLKVGGKFLSRMEAKDGSTGFDFWGIYDQVEKHKKINYTLGDSRKVWITFFEDNNKTKIQQIFEAENTHPIEMQQAGWQAILNSFKEYVEK